MGAIFKDNMTYFDKSKQRDELTKLNASNVVDLTVSVDSNSEGSGRKVSKKKKLVDTNM